jgi:hypothetical protein
MRHAETRRAPLASATPGPAPSRRRRHGGGGRAGGDGLLQQPAGHAGPHGRLAHPGVGVGWRRRARNRRRARRTGSDPRHQPRLGRGLPPGREPPRQRARRPVRRRRPAARPRPAAGRRGRPVAGVRARRGRPPRVRAAPRLRDERPAHRVPRPRRGGRAGRRPVGDLPAVHPRTRRRPARRAREGPAHRPADQPQRTALRLPADDRRRRRARRGHRGYGERRAAAGPRQPGRQDAAARPDDGAAGGGQPVRVGREPEGAVRLHLRPPQRPGRRRAARHRGPVLGRARPGPRRRGQPA